MLIIGGLIIILGYTLEDMVFHIQRRYNKAEYKHLEWILNEVLQTQRVAHEQLGIGPWEGCAGFHDIPVTVKKGLNLALLDTENTKHPRLRLSERPQPNGQLTVVTQDSESQGNAGAGESLAIPSVVESQGPETESKNFQADGEHIADLEISSSPTHRPASVNAPCVAGNGSSEENSQGHHEIQSTSDGEFGNESHRPNKSQEDRAQ